MRQKRSPYRRSRRLGRISQRLNLTRRTFLVHIFSRLAQADAQIQRSPGFGALPTWQITLIRYHPEEMPVPHRGTVLRE